MMDGRPWIDRLPYRREPTEEELLDSLRRTPAASILLEVARSLGVPRELLDPDGLGGSYDTGSEEIGREAEAPDPETTNSREDRQE